MLFGSKHEKDVKKLQPVLQEVHKFYNEFNSLSDDDLRAKTQEFKEIIQSRILDFEEEKKSIIDRLKAEALNAADSFELSSRVKELDKEIIEEIKATLDELLPPAFAAVKQACRRLKEQGFGYEYAGQHYVWDMVPFDVQLIGGMILHHGKISEMATGEGKTLVAILPLYLNALAGLGVHLVTVNDYLALRDSQWMTPVFEFLGLTVGAIQSNMESEERKRIYNCDISYGTNNEFGFDYLRDNMVHESEQLVQRLHFYAIVDEVDSVLIDEARTPLIISGPVGQSDQKFDEMNPRVRRLVEAQNKLINQLAFEAENLLKTDKKEDRERAGKNLLSAHRALPKHKKLLKLMQEPDYQKLLRETELFYLQDQGRKMHEIDDDLYYTIDEKNHNIDISEKGRQLLCSATEDAEMFVIPDIASQMSIFEADHSMTSEEKQIKKDEIYLVYAERSDRIHTISQLLRAYSLYEKDIEYVIQEGKVMIVDEFTGRILDGRRYSEGLHQAIEAKEHVTVEKDTQTFATITLQNYFRLYKKLAGMTGTAETEAGEFEKIYNLDVVVVPTNKPIIREDSDDLIYRTKKEKYAAIVKEIREQIQKGRAVLVGTTSVEVSEILSKILLRQGIHHNVLNAKQHAREAEIVAGAGRKGALTIATNMAGRGTDIKLDHEVKKNGGLCIIGSERHDARRIDRQLRGRSGRQGDPGSTQFFISLEDDLMRLFGGERIASIMQRMKVPEGEPIQHSLITKSVEKAQKKVEENNFAIRKRLLDYDNVMNQQREVIYTRRRQALSGERLKGELFEYVENIAENWFEEFHPKVQLDEIIKHTRALFLCEPKIELKEFENMKLETFIQRVVTAADEFYTRKEEILGSEFMAYLERVAILQTIDDKWREHLRVMDDLKEGIHLRAYGQKDPLLEYKGEAYRSFVNLLDDINKETLGLVFKTYPRNYGIDGRLDQGKGRKTAEIPRLRTKQPTKAALNYQHSSEIPSYLRANPNANPEQQQQETETVTMVRRSQPKIGRNDKCYCGSGRKYKQCHGKNENFD
ncbi:MAG: preprotein translocase subunit SecA [Candidatus Kapabacteria bacterium]|nr:preprotein translocase subunit SecA [Candidatus Kapabacteria bacterium]